MKNPFKYIVFAVCALSGLTAYAATGTDETEGTAADRPKGNLGLSIDLVSANIWRGSYLTGVSLQPGISFDIAGFSVGAWGSTDFNYGGSGYSELDFMVGYLRFTIEVQF